MTRALVAERSRAPGRRRTWLRRVAGAAVLLLAAAPTALGGETRRVSVNADGIEGNAASGSAAVSRSGRFVAFASAATNLVPGDTNGEPDIFVRDLKLGKTERVSLGSGGVQGDAISFSPSISANGRYVAFASHATNLVAGDTNEMADIFLHDRKTGLTTRVSLGAGGVEGDLSSAEPSISANGRYVAFRSFASNLVAGDTNGTADIFLFDRKKGQLARVSVDSAGIEGNASSLGPAISANGRYVAFRSGATNLVPGDTNAVQDIFVHDAKSRRTTRASTSSAGFEADGDSDGAAISASGRFVSFHSEASNLVQGDTNREFDVFVHDRKSGATTRVSLSSAGPEGNAASSASSISDNGRLVAFASDATNFVPGDTNGKPDIFVHDRKKGTTTRVSVNSDGVQADGNSLAPALSGNGRFVAFEANATQLVPGDTNDTYDVFAHDRK